MADFYSGSFTTAEVCKDTNRNFIGCDINPIAYEIGKKRVGDFLKISTSNSLSNETISQALNLPTVVGRSEQLKCGNQNPPCAPNLKFGMLECCECNWSE